MKKKVEALRREMFPQIPADFPVKPLLPGEKAEDQTTCFTCGLSWDDAIVTSMTPAPAARCPFEEFHAYGIYKDDPIKLDDPEHAHDKAAHHTPGPWQADKWAPGWTVSAPEQHYSVCHLEGCNNADTNARLIAAAPDLLEACKAIVECDSPMQDQGGDWGSTEWFEWVGQAIEQAKAAIVKARS